jgi:hypothetical protein
MMRHKTTGFRNITGILTNAGVDKQAADTASRAFRIYSAWGEGPHRNPKQITRGQFEDAAISLNKTFGNMKEAQRAAVLENIDRGHARIKSREDNGSLVLRIAIIAATTFGLAYIADSILTAAVIKPSDTQFTRGAISTISLLAGFIASVTMSLKYFDKLVSFTESVLEQAFKRPAERLWVFEMVVRTAKEKPAAERTTVFS